jgi:hypothetical protein
MIPEEPEELDINFLPDRDRLDLENMELKILVIRLTHYLTIMGTCADQEYNQAVFELALKNIPDWALAAKNRIEGVKPLAVSWLKNSERSDEEG